MFLRGNRWERGNNSIKTGFCAVPTLEKGWEHVGTNTENTVTGLNLFPPVPTWEQQWEQSKPL